MALGLLAKLKEKWQTRKQRQQEREEKDRFYNNIMSNIPIVQGVSIPPYGGGGSNSNSNSKQQSPYYHHQGSPINATAISAEELNSRRQNPGKQFQDGIWAFLFISHLIAMIGFITLGIRWNGNNNSGGGYYNKQGNGTGRYASMTSLVLITALVAVVASILSLQFMMKNAEGLVQVALVFSVISSLVVAVLGFMIGSMLMGIVGLISFAVGICYAKIVWPRIPFAAANLNTALTAVKANLGLTVLSLAFSGLAVAWTILWFMGVSDALSSGNAVTVFFLFLSFYWVHQVLQNTMHVTTAGVVGTWWFVPTEANSFWSPALSDSACRATTYSFGSICFGSLLVAIIQALRALEQHFRDADDNQFVACIIQCILGFFEGIIEFINRWAYVYVGLYGFNYLEAGRNVMQLFEAKGWTAIISDDLANNVLFMMSVALGLISGLVGMIMGFMDQNMFYKLGFDHAAGPGFLIGLLTGFLISSIIMSVVGSGVSTVIVCYAEDPAAFQMNHPELSSQMREAWVQAWPDLVY